jgi:hypothetical protein
MVFETPYPYREMKGFESQGLEFRKDFLDARLVRKFRVRIRLSRERFRRIFAPLPMNAVEPLRLRVEGLKVFVGERPGRRNAVGVAEFAEILLSQPEKSGAKHLGLSAHEIGLTGTEGTTVFRQPTLRGVIDFLPENLPGIPIVLRALQKCAALEHENGFSGGSQRVGESASARTRAEN